MRSALQYDLSDLENGLCECPGKLTFSFCTCHILECFSRFLSLEDSVALSEINTKFTGTGFGFNLLPPRPRDNWSYLFCPSTPYPIIVLEGAQITT